MKSVISQVTNQEVDVYKHIRSTQGWLVLIQLTFYSALLQDSELSKVSAILVDQRLLHWWSGNLSTSYVYHS
jgi:hypothetical protein